FTDRVIVNRWPGYRAQKQFALDSARGEWVLNVDADERVTPELIAEIERALARPAPGVDGFAIPRLVCYLGRWWYRGGWYPRRVPRLVRRERARWGGIDPHERAEVEGRVVSLHWPILHYTYANVSDHLRSMNKLTTIAAAERVAAPVGVGRLVLEPLWRFMRAYVVRGLWLDRFPGLFVAVAGAFYVFLRWAKVGERWAAERLDRPPGRSWRGGRRHAQRAHHGRRGVLPGACVREGHRPPRLGAAADAGGREHAPAPRRARRAPHARDVLRPRLGRRASPGARRRDRRRGPRD